MTTSGRRLSAAWANQAPSGACSKGRRGSGVDTENTSQWSLVMAMAEWQAGHRYRSSRINLPDLPDLLRLSLLEQPP